MIDSAVQVRYASGVTSAPRRSPQPEDRLRDAERTKRALLDAALTEFAAKGYDGARVNEIAERAGVNKQLISYYFGGKEGLYDTIVAHWYELEATLTEPGISLADLAVRYLEVGHDQPDLIRLFIRESLDSEPGDVVYAPDDPEVADMRARQRAGEIAPDLDPAFVLLVLQGIVTWLTMQRRDVTRYLGLDMRSPEYLEFARSQLRLLVGRLGTLTEVEPGEPVQPSR